MRRTLASAPSLLAVAAILACAPHAARAQSFNATGTIVAGTGAITTAPGNTTVVVDSTPNMVINWTPTDTAIGGGPINFQSAGTNALFTNGTATAISVLNRILPTDPARAIVFNGTVTSQLVNAATGLATRGGTLFFYSPGGIIVSSTGVFNVGNLALTASDLAFNPSTGEFGPGGTYSFRQASPGSRVEIRSGAQITAGPLNAYVALVAPKVVNAGNITVDGSAVIVAADAATISFRPSGLYDIQIDQGTSAAGEVVTNTGTITGPATGPNTSHRVYMVAVPKNDAITMAIKGGSTLGFDVAGAADVVGNTVILSAGFDVTNGEIDAVRSSANGTIPARLAIGPINATSQVTGKATGQASVTVDGGNTSNFASNLLLSGVAEPGSGSTDSTIVSVAGIGSTLSIAGDLVVTSLDAGQVAGGLFTDTGNARVLVDGGNLGVTGDVTVDAGRVDTKGIDMIAGEASLEARNAGQVTIGGDFQVAANGLGKLASAVSATGPNPGTGGTGRLTLAGGSTITVGGDLTIDASGGGGGAASDGYIGTLGVGGRAVIEAGVDAGTLNVTGTTLLDARGIGGNGQNCTACVVEGGAGIGGNAGIIAAKGSTFNFGNAVTIDASAQGGSASVDSGHLGGDAQGGNAFLRTSGGTITGQQAVSILAEATGGNGASYASALSGAPNSGGNGGSAIGGTASITAGDETTLGQGGSISATGATVISASATGGTGGTGGNAVAGTAQISARNGSMTGSTLSVQAIGEGGGGANAGAGGNGRGGAALMQAYGALEGGAAINFTSAAMSARGQGGSGSSPIFFTNAGGAGGAGTGGSVRALAEAGNGTISIGTFSANAVGNGGAGGDALAIGAIPGTGENGGNGGVGRGGTARIGVVSGLDTGAVNTGSLTLADSTVTANGNGGNGGLASAANVTPGLRGNGGNGYGGGAGLVVEGGTVTLNAPAQFEANGLGGSTVGAAIAGDGFVGDAGGASSPFGSRLEVGSRTGHPGQQGTLTATSLTFTASAVGGDGNPLGDAIILGHPLVWRVNGGTINANSIDFIAVGTAAPGVLPSEIALTGGNTTLTGDLNFRTPGTLTATLDGADVRTINASIAAADWLPGAAPTGTVGTLIGSTSVSLQTGNDLFGRFSVNSGGAFGLIATGQVRLDNLTAVGNLSLSAGSTLLVANVTSSTGRVDISAPGDVTVGTVSAVTSATLASGADLVTGGVTAGQTVRLRGVTSAATSGAIQAGDSVFVSSGGAVNTGAISAGLVSPSPVSGAQYDITVSGGGGVTVGNLGAAHDIVLLSPLSVTSGTLFGREMAVLAGGAQNLGAINASGRVLLADFGMGAIGGDPLGAYDLNAVLASAPTASTGPISVSGSVQAGALVARSVGNIALGAITTTALGTTGDVDLGAGGALITGTISAAGAASVTAAGSAVLGDVTATGPLGGVGIRIAAGPALTVGRAYAIEGDLVLNSIGTITTGALETSDGLIGLTSGGAMNLGTLTSSTLISLGSGGTIAAGDLLSQFGVAVTGAADVSVGRITTSTGTANLTAATNLTTGDMTAYDGITLGTTTGDITAGTLQSDNGAITIASAGNLTLTGNALSFAGDIALTAAGTIGTQVISAATGQIRLDAGAAITTGNLGAGGPVLVTSLAAVTLGNIDAGGDAILNAGLGLTAGSIAAQGNAAVTSGAGLTVGAVTSALGDVGLTAANDLVSGSVQADFALYLTSTGGSITTGDVVTQGPAAVIQASGNIATGLISSVSGRVNAQAGGSLVTGNVTAAIGGVVLGARGDLAAGAVTTDGTISLSSSAGAVRAGALISGSDIAAKSAGAMNLASANAAGTLVVDSGGAMVASDLTGVSGVTVTGQAAITAGNVGASGGAVSLTATGGLATGAIAAGDAVTLLSNSAGVSTGAINSTVSTVTLTAAGAGSAGTITAGDTITLTTGGNLDLITVTASSGGILLDSGGNLAAQNLVATTGPVQTRATGATRIDGASAATVLSVRSGGALIAGNLEGVTGVTVAGAGAVTTGSVRASSGAVSVSGTSALTTGTVTATGAVSLESTGGAIDAQTITAGGDLVLKAGGAITSRLIDVAGGLVATGTAITINGDVRAGRVAMTADGAIVTDAITARTGNVALSSGGAMTLEGVIAAGAVRLASGAAMTVDTVGAGGAVRAVSATSAAFGEVSSQTGTVELQAAGGALSAGRIVAGTDAALLAATDLAMGPVAARDMVLLAGGNVTTGSLTAAADGRILIGSTAMASPGGAFGAFDYEAVFADQLIAAGGTAAITGPVSSGSLTMAVLGDAALADAAARSILIDSGGTVRLGGVLRAPLITLAANDLVMPSGSGLNAGLTGTISLISRNAAGMRIGDGLDGSVVPITGFSIDNAEWSRINSGSVNVFGLDGAGAVDIVIGRLDVTGPDAGSTIDDPTGSVRFSTGVSPAAAASGAIRVAGALRAVGFRSGNALVFRTGQFQLASDTGSLAVLGKGDALSGTLRINARDIHIAATPLLARLASDPFFSGVEPALDSVSAGGNGPVLRAGALDFSVGRTFYIQRSGSGVDPLGFEEPLGGITVRATGGSPVTVIINGTFRTATGLVSGVEAWKQFKASGVDLSGFSADSRLNGCLLSAAACGPGVITDRNPDPGLRPLIDRIDDEPDGKPDDPDESNGQGSNAIMPPQSVLSVQPDALPPEINEPIAGSGNPALITASAGAAQGARP